MTMLTFQYNPEHSIRNDFMDDIIDAPAVLSMVPVTLDRSKREWIMGGYYNTQMTFTHHERRCTLNVYWQNNLLKLITL